MSNVFVIINEWTTPDGATSSEVTDGKFFRDQDHAWEALNLVAQSYHVELKPDETNIYLEGNLPRLQSEEYWIQELTEGPSV